MSDRRNPGPVSEAERELRRRVWRQLTPQQRRSIIRSGLAGRMLTWLPEMDGREIEDVPTGGLV